VGRKNRRVPTMRANLLRYRLSGPHARSAQCTFTKYQRDAWEGSNCRRKVRAPILRVGCFAI
jgi:hypothetical protein